MFVWNEYRSAAEVDEALAQAVADALAQTLQQKGAAVLAVSGGRSPVGFFEALSRKPLAWNKISVTLVDERIVPTGHEDSNTALVRRHLLKNAAAAASWIPMVDDEAANGLQPEAASTYARLHFRQPDVAVLGMGGDGHTASLFPESPQLAAGIDPDNTDGLLHTTPVTAPHERISMTLKAVTDTPHLFLAIRGSSKKDVFERAAAQADAQYPVSLVLNQKGVQCHVFYAD